jgi:hypothetical protein
MNRSTLRIVIIITAVITALVHLALGIGGIAGGDPGMLDYLFVLNGLGYLTLLAGLFVPNFPVLGGNRALAHYLMIIFAGLTFVLYFVFNGFSNIGAAAIVAKLAEIVLIIATFMHLGASE